MTSNTLVELMSEALDEAERKAFEALGMFGYHASQWVKLNQLLGHPRHNPFRQLVEAARVKLDKEEK